MSDSPEADSLEANSLWYQYKTRVWLAETPETAAIHNTMRTLRSIRNSGRLAYISVPITSGKYLYDLKLANKPVNIQDVISYNYQMGWDLVNSVVARRNIPVLYPAELVAARQKWKDEHYQALWLSIIAEKCTELHMCNGWAFSNGGAEEFVHVMQLRLGLPMHKNVAFYNTKGSEQLERMRMLGIAVYDHLGNALSIEDGIDSIQKARSWIAGHGFDAPRLKTCVDLLAWTKKKISESFYQ